MCLVLSAWIEDMQDIIWTRIIDPTVNSLLVILCNVVQEILLSLFRNNKYIDSLIILAVNLPLVFEESQFNTLLLTATLREDGLTMISVSTHNMLRRASSTYLNNHRKWNSNKVDIAYFFWPICDPFDVRWKQITLMKSQNYEFSVAPKMATKVCCE